MSRSYRGSVWPLQPLLLVVGAASIAVTVLLDGPVVFERLGILLQVVVVASAAIRLTHLTARRRKITAGNGAGGFRFTRAMTLKEDLLWIP